MDTLQGTGKTYTGTKLVYIFNEINKRMQTEGHDKKQLVFCGPNNKSVDLVASKFFFLHKISGKSHLLINLWPLVYVKPGSR